MYYKTVIRVEILTDGPYEWDSLGGVVFDMYNGHTSGYVDEVESKQITEEELITECEKHVTDPTFFTECSAETGEDNDAR